MSKGICVAGNLTLDILYPVSNWPNRGELVKIQDGISRATGGAVCNVAMDLAMLDPALHVQAVGKIGTDAEGDYVLERMCEHPSIDVSGIRREGITSFTAVMNDQTSGERTFFTYPGANGRFCENDIDWHAVDAEIFHIGYILLSDALDAEDAEYGTKMARLLCHAQEHGLRTSVDVVSEAGDRFNRLVPPALKYADYCIINELEAQQSTGVPLRDAEGRLLTENMPAALRAMKAMGVSTWAVIHAPEGGFGLDEHDHFAALESLHLPKGWIKGTVGAGDAFCAGVLLSAARGETIESAIRLGNAAAACSLSEPGSTEGMRTAEDALKLYQTLK